MPAVMIGCTYLGVALCYAASSSAPTADNGDWGWNRPGAGRLLGLLLLGLGGGRAVMTSPIGEGLLVLAATAMAAGSVLVIAAPLLDRFVAVSGALAGGLTVLGLFL